MKSKTWAISCLSLWEVAIKHQSGKLSLPCSLNSWWKLVVKHFELNVLPFTDSQALITATLPPHHQDPFDRAIISTAIDLDIPIITLDSGFYVYRDSSPLNLL